MVGSFPFGDDQASNAEAVRSCWFLGFLVGSRSLPLSCLVLQNAWLGLVAAHCNFQMFSLKPGDVGAYDCT